MNVKREKYNTFLKLVRVGIGTSKDVKFSNEVDWNFMKAFADEQGLSAIVIDCLNQYHKDDKTKIDGLSDDLLLLWIGEVWRDYENRYESYETAISELAGFYSTYGFKMMVLKGYACSLDWPKSNHRPCGDIDIWLFGKNKEADEVLVKEKNLKIDNSHHHHTVFHWNGFDVENHYDFVNVYAHRSSAELEKVFKGLGDISHIENLESTDMPSSKSNGFNIINVMLAGQKVYIPSPNLHALFLIRHMVSHFAAGRISLRQLLDWAFFVEKHSGEIDWEWLIDLLEKYQMNDFFDCVNAICIGDLGFDVKLFPRVQFAPALKDKVLNDILNPTFSEKEPSRLLKRVIFKYRRWKNNRWKYELCYKESVWTAFWRSVWSHLLKPKSI